MFLWLSMYFNTRVLVKGTIFTSPLFYDLIQATQTFISLQGKGSTFIIIFKTLSIGSAPRIEPTTSRSADRRSPNWANQAHTAYSLNGCIKWNT